MKLPKLSKKQIALGFVGGLATHLMLTFINFKKMEKEENELIKQTVDSAMKSVRANQAKKTEEQFERITEDFKVKSEESLKGFKGQYEQMYFVTVDEWLKEPDKYFRDPNAVLTFDDEP